MEENKQPVITQAVATAQINIALTQQSISIQKMQDEADKLIFDEEHLSEVNNFVYKTKKSRKVVEDKHKVMKAPVLEQGRAIDAAKNSILASIDAIESPVEAKRIKLCAEIDRKKEEILKEKTRVEAIEKGIEENLIEFSKKIAECTTNEALLSVERLINLEKSESRQSKYMEFHENAKKRYDEILLPRLKAQKIEIKKLEALRKEIKDAEINNDATRLDELMIKQDEIGNQIRQNQVDVQHYAMSSQVSLNSNIAEEILPEISIKHNIKFEIQDVFVALRKCPELIDVSLKFRETQKVSMALKDAGVFDNKSEVIVNGIKFFMDKKY
jgi:hypothetical protein